ncbi:hypothetical protein QBC37DRAFT_113180 [Rhypophila decipiens]|uniref:DUF6590 domain-containing protein n=1 Tax=Rhypophila decipiens TaxID=261697 RepID=A0AAN6YBE4_9PEZI|nr:hypothetical protein QBC37DRAFT_113180 [Rhypophila decipiens]
MSGNRRSNQGPRYDWVPPEAQQQQHTQYGNQGGIDHITAGLSGVSLHNPTYGQGTGYESVPYSPEGQYQHYQPNSYAYPQDPSYPSQESGYSQAAAYPADPQYAQGGQYPTDGYEYPNVDNSVDPNSQYTTTARQQYPAHHKGKLRAVDQAGNNKPKSSRDKPRDRERDHGKGRSSASKSGRSKSGKGQAEEDPAQDETDEHTPFYRGPASPQQGTAALDDSQGGGTTAFNAPADGAVYDDSYTTTPQPTGDQGLSYEGHAAAPEDSTGYPYGDPYASNDYQGAHGSGSRQTGMEDTHSQSSYRSPMSSEPYPADLPDDLASAIAESDGYTVAGSSHLIGDDAGVGASGDHTYPGYEDGPGLQTPRATTPQVALASTVGQAELDERYIVEPSSRFYTGDVFKVLWSEPLGAGRADMTDAEARSHLGQRFYVGIRRFIIVRTDEGHSTCVPILTYERRACTKRGVKPRTHGIIYPDGTRPRPLDGEPPLGCKPVKIELDFPQERIVKESRVNYAKLVTIEHNVKVFFIGRVAAEHLHLVNESVDKCWEYKNKLSHSKGDSGRKHYPNYSYRNR